MTHYRQLLAVESHNALNKWSHYPEVYDEVFGRYCESCRAALEIGVRVQSESPSTLDQSVVDSSARSGRATFLRR